MITVESLSKRYGRFQAVEDVSFRVPDAAVTGFLGPNGSGKSTTMRCVLGLDRPSAGRALFDGEGFGQVVDKPAVAGALLEASWFTPGRSGRSHLKVLARGAGISDARVDKCLQLVGLASAGGKRVGGYSLGMKQRLGLAGALLGDPSHLILDEPVNGLDPEGVSWMRRTIRALAAEGRAVLVSSHLLSEMQQTADRLVVIGKGRMIGEYSMEEFLAGGARVVVETVDARSGEALSTALGNAGFTAGYAVGDNAGEASGSQLTVDVPDGVSDEIVRRAVAETAFTAGVLVTGLRADSEDLESRFLAATADAQEYRTESTDAAVDPTAGK
ncbi:ABC transporter ATP-binding protein [Corynebacterium glyciniphilum]|uniref:ABC transporter ATP-binding protein n=1 Tax=Corynebacterium glyciniphilum TaxID=1404244 RepID=UPI00265474A2|nr:ABC transporter ATP-binding protein [Corynebacterium glyciniphilum]MDN6705270.1 ABC transporter ATP-binding protein [Corynebacterium glyciniphilum]